MHDGSSGPAAKKTLTDGEGVGGLGDGDGPLLGEPARAAAAAASTVVPSG